MPSSAADTVTTTELDVMGEPPPTALSPQPPPGGFQGGRGAGGLLKASGAPANSAGIGDWAGSVAAAEELAAAPEVAVGLPQDDPRPRPGDAAERRAPRAAAVERNGGPPPGLGPDDDRSVAPPPRSRPSPCDCLFKDGGDGDGV